MLSSCAKANAHLCRQILKFGQANRDSCCLLVVQELNQTGQGRLQPPTLLTVAMALLTKAAKSEMS